MEKEIKITDEQLKTEVTTSRRFILGGKSEFTIENLSTGTYYKYKVTKSKDNENLFFVRVMGENGKWFYAGYLNLQYGWYRQGRNGNLQHGCYRQGRNGKLGPDTPQIRGLLYALRREEGLPRPMILMHHGRCACCGHKLNDPISVARGIGPDCWKKRGF